MTDITFRGCSMLPPPHRRLESFELGIEECVEVRQGKRTSAEEKDMGQLVVVEELHITPCVQPPE